MKETKKVFQLCILIWFTGFILLYRNSDSFIGALLMTGGGMGMILISLRDLMEL